MARKKSEDNMEYYQTMTYEGLVDKPKEKKDIPRTIVKVKKKYFYKGPVYRFNTLVISNYEKTTMAISEAQAVNNIIYSIKMKLGYTAGASGIKLKGKLYTEEELKNEISNT